MVLAISFFVRSIPAFGESAIANTLMLLALVTHAIFMDTLFVERGLRR